MEFFITARSFAAPFFSDTSETYREGASARDALDEYVSFYSHPCGLYAAEIWLTADDYHKRKVPLYRYLSNMAKRQLAAASSLSYDDVENPREGKVYDGAVVRL